MPAFTVMPAFLSVSVDDSLQLEFFSEQVTVFAAIQLPFVNYFVVQNKEIVIAVRVGWRNRGDSLSRTKRDSLTRTDLIEEPLQSETSVFRNDSCHIH